MDSESRDRYETDNLVWQLEVTFNKLAAICKKNGRLVDYIGKKVDGTVDAWNQQKAHFKQLSWADLDDSDLELDLDITLPISPITTSTSPDTTFKGAKGEQEQPSSAPQSETAVTAPEPDTTDAKQSEKNPDTDADDNADADANEGVLGAHSEDLKRLKVRASLRSVEKKVAATAKVEHEASVLKKESLRLRLERALQRKQHQQKLVGLRQQSQQDKVKSIRLHSAQENEENLNRMQQRHDRAQMNVQRLAREKLIRKYLFIPRVVRKSESINLYADIERFYRGTLALLNTNKAQQTTKSQATLAKLITTWLRGTADKNFEDAQYDRDVLLVTNRLICFDVRAASPATQRQMLAMLAQTTRNRMAAELLALRYLDKLLALFKANVQCVDYTLLAVLVGRCLADPPSSKRRGLTGQGRARGDSEYQRFRKQTHAVLLRELERSQLLSSAATILQKAEDAASVRAVLEVLARVPVLLSKHYHGNQAVCRALLAQTKSTRCVELALQCAVGSTTADSENMDAALSFAGEMLRFAATIGFDHGELALTVATTSWVATKMALSTESETKLLSKPFLRFVAALTLGSSSSVSTSVDAALLARLSQETLAESDELCYAAMLGLTLRCEEGRQRMASWIREDLRQWIARKMDGGKPRRQRSARGKEKKGGSKADEEWLKVLLPPKMLKESLRLYRRSG